MDGPVRSTILEGILVLDFSQAEAGPLATQVLSDFGARVIKVERFPAGDLLRRDWGHELDGMYLPFASLNRGKESLCLDARSSEGRDVLHRLLERADVVVHNFRPGVMERLGLDYERLHATYPRIVYAEASGYGRTGPWAKRGGQDILAQAITGAMWQNSPQGDRPLPVGYPVADHASATGVLSGVLLGLLKREWTGEGCRVESSLIEGLLFAMVQEVTEAQAGFRLTQGNDPLAGVFRAKDGFLTVMPIWRDTAVEDFLSVIGYEPGLTEPRMATLERRRENAGWVREQVEDRLRQRSVDEWIERLDERNLLCAPVLDMARLEGHPQIQALEPFVDVRRSDGRLLGRTVRSHFRIDGAGGTAGTVPDLGQHTEGILREVGYSDREVDLMASQGTVFLGGSDTNGRKGDSQ